MLYHAIKDPVLEWNIKINLFPACMKIQELHFFPDGKRSLQYNIPPVRSIFNLFLNGAQEKNGNNFQRWYSLIITGDIYVEFNLIFYYVSRSFIALKRISYSWNLHLLFTEYQSYVIVTNMCFSTIINIYRG